MTTYHARAVAEAMRECHHPVQFDMLHCGRKQAGHLVALLKRKRFNMAAIEVTEQTFEEEVLKSDKPVLVDFWAVWCGPCNMLAPTVDMVSEEHPEIKVCKVNTDEQPGLAMKYGITAIPALYFFKGGELAGKSIGAVPKSQVEALIAK